MGKNIKDPIHGYITVDEEWIENIVDTKYFQRLRNIRQLDTTRTVYPSANHTRFDHTLGVYHLGKQAFESIKSDGTFAALDPDEVKQLRRTFECACLCHDIGHFPFSHLGESFVDDESIIRVIKDSDYELIQRLEKADRKDAAEKGEAGSHELMGCAIVLDRLGGDIEDAFNPVNVDPVDVCSFILGTTTRTDSWQWEATAQLLSSEIDVDRLDYMLRDDHMSGASLVSVDSDRMVEAYTTVNEKLALSTKAHSTIGNYLQGRNDVYLWIAQHHKVVYSNAAIEFMIDELHDIKDKDGFTSEDILDRGIDDAYLIQELRYNAREGDSDLLTKLHERYQARDYLASCWSTAIEETMPISTGRVDDLTQQLGNVRYDFGGRYEFAEELARRLGIDRHQVLARNSTVSGYDYDDLSSIILDDEGEDEKITKFSLYDTNPDLFSPTPFVFVPGDEVKSAIDEINDMSLPL